MTTSQFNFPNLTTSELDAVTDATEGDTYFDADRGQFVRFTGPSSYDVISSISSVSEDSLTASSGITLPASRFFESGLVADDDDPFAPQNIVRIYDNDQLGNASLPSGYFYYSGSAAPVGWYDPDNLGAGLVTGPVVAQNKIYRIRSNGSQYSFSFKKIAVSSTTLNELLSIPLSGGSKYKIEINVFIGDLAEGNLIMNLGYTGLYNDSTIQLKCNDLKNKNQILSLKGSLTENDNIYFASNTIVGVDSPLLGSYSITMILEPSSSGTFNMSVRQETSDVNPLLIGDTEAMITKLS